MSFRETYWTTLHSTLCTHPYPVPSWSSPPLSRAGWCFFMFYSHKHIIIFLDVLAHNITCGLIHKFKVVEFTLFNQGCIAFHECPEKACVVIFMYAFRWRHLMKPLWWWGSLRWRSSRTWRKLTTANLLLDIYSVSFKTSAHTHSGNHTLLLAILQVKS